MSSLTKKIKNYKNDENQRYSDSDIHAITKKCGNKLKNFVGDDVQMSESEAAAIKLTTSLRDQLTADTPQRRTTTRSTGQGQGSSRRHLSSADYASCAKMEQSKWLAAKNRPVPKRELPPRVRSRREDIVRRFREKADRYADVAMKVREKVKDAQGDGPVEEIPFSFLSKDDLRRYNIISGRSMENAYPSDITLTSMTSDTSVSTRTDLDPDKIVKKCLKECKSIFNVPVPTDPISYAPKPPDAYNNVKSRENEIPKNRKIKSMFSKKKSSLGSRTDSSKEAESVDEVREPLSKTIQKIIEKQEAFMNDCNKILNPSKFEFSQVIQSLSKKQRKTLVSESEESLNSNKRLDDFLRAKRGNVFKVNSFLNNIEENLIPTETPKSAGESIRTRVSSISKGGFIKYSRESDSSTPSYISSIVASSKRTTSLNEINDSEIKKLFTKEPFSFMSPSQENLSILSGTSTRCKLAQDVFSWKTTQKQPKSFNAEDFLSEHEEGSTRHHPPVLNLKFYSDNVEGHSDGDEEVKPIKLQKSTTIEVQVPIIESPKIVDGGSKQEKNKNEGTFKRLAGIMARKVLSEKPSTHPDQLNTPLAIIKNTLKNDGVELRMRNIPEVSTRRSKRINYFSLSKGPLEEHESSEFIHHSKLFNLQYLHSMRAVTVQH